MQDQEEKVDPISLTQKQVSPYQEKAQVDPCSLTQKLVSNQESMVVRNPQLVPAANLTMKAPSESDSSKGLSFQSYRLPYIKPLSSDKQK